MSRISWGQLSIKHESVEITRIVQDVVDRMRPEFTAAGIPLTLEMGPAAHGRWDRLRIEQVLWNLLSNAMRYGGQSPVRIHAGAVEGQAQISVKDEGPGIPADAQERIFEKFQRVGSQRISFGLGLGLHICKHVVELHGGQIGVQSLPGCGARFSVTLPCDKLARVE